MRRKTVWRIVGLLLALSVLFVIGGVAGAASTVITVVTDGFYPSTSGPSIAFHVLERYVERDLNNDGDTDDFVIGHYDTSTGEVKNTGVWGAMTSISGSIIAFGTREQYIAQDLNNDGDVNDYVIRYYNISTGDVTNTGIEGSEPSISGSIIAFNTHEVQTGQDLTGDGDTNDWAVRYFDTETSETTNIGAGHRPRMSGSVIAFWASERDVGQDLNGDGDTNDPVIRYYETATGELFDTGAEGYWASISGSVIVFTTPEYQIENDLNGDGDTNDWVIRYYDMPSGEVANTAAVGGAAAISGSNIVFGTRELAIGQDLNGDGDTNDSVIMHHDTATGETTSTGADGHNPSIGGSTVTFYTLESIVGDDLNSDGDINDGVIRYVKIDETQSTGDISDIKDIVDGALGDGSIDNQGMAEAMHAFLDQAQAMIARNNQEAAVRIIDAFINLIEAQSGKHITPEAAQTLIDLASSLVWS